MKFLSVLVLILTSFVVALATADQPWINNVDLMKLQEDKHAHTAPEFVVNLDLAPEDRWKEIGELYADKAWQIVNYLR